MGTTLLHIAAQHSLEKPSILAALVEHTVLRYGSVDQKAVAGRTPLHICTKEGNLSGMMALLENGAFISCKDKGGDTPLHLAVETGNIEAVKLLLSYGASASIKNKRKEKPIVLARKFSERFPPEKSLKPEQIEEKTKFWPFSICLFRCRTNAQNRTKIKRETYGS
eukprot:TRINITY_DN7432_c0_g1_i2.p1 TRINITY_DN7432_c0_g1~~TRINITY_DN7432_c0_g1_i2.p1  ORF type:complete len:166 (+),score=17.11 TRINITY_DN7432_c0_g1_i2:232-729(+)